MSSVMSVGAFQVQNLIRADVPFSFFYLDSKSDLAEEPLLQSAQVVDSAQALDSIYQLEKTSPVIVMCNSGKRAKHLAGVLESDGYKNVYCVDCGLPAFMRELKESL